MQEFKTIIETKKEHGCHVTKILDIHPTRYEGYYVSFLGDIYSFKGDNPKRLKAFERGGSYKAKYLSVNICEERGQQPEYIHRLVASVFSPNIDPMTKTQVNHIDGNRKNNRADNLEWVTPQQNTDHKLNRWKYSNMTPLFDLECLQAS